MKTLENLYCLVGPSGCGKTTLSDMLAQYYGAHPVVSFTTREIRKGEKNGREHWFISNREFDSLGELAAFTDFSGERYGVTVEMLKHCDVYVIDPPGVDYLKKTVKDRRIIVIGLDPGPVACAERMKERGDSKEKIAERLEHDETCFQDLPAYSDVMLDATLPADKLAEQVWGVIQSYEQNGLTCQRLARILTNYVEYDEEAAESGYVLEILEHCGCTAGDLEKLGLDYLLADD